MARILVIEDDVGVQTPMRDVLTGVGHAVFVADNGHQRLARYSYCQPDVVITDIFMPQRNGLDVIREVASSGVMIVATSSGGDVDVAAHLDDAIQLGARRILARPFTAVALIEAVDMTLADLKCRGLGDPLLVVTDGAPGLIRD